MVVFYVAVSIVERVAAMVRLLSVAMTPDARVALACQRAFCARYSLPKLQQWLKRVRRLSKPRSFVKHLLNH